MMLTILGIAMADFKERSRRFSFITMMIIALYAAFFFVPSSNSGVTSSVIAIMPETFFQADNPSWIPITSAWGLGLILPLIGLFYLRNSIAFDEKTGVEQLITISPTNNFLYLCGKVLSGTLLMYCFVAVTMIGSYCMILWRFPGHFLSAYDFLSPFLFLFVSAAFISALAIVFESVSLLRGGIGSVLFVFGYIAITNQLTSNPHVFDSLALRALDITGTSLIYDAIENAVFTASGLTLSTVIFAFQITTIGFSPTVPLFFYGVPIRNIEIAAFSLTIVYSVSLVLLATVLYGFSNKEYIIKKSIDRNGNNLHTIGDRAVPISNVYFAVPTMNERSWSYMILTELKLMLAGQPIIWKFGFILGMAGCIFLDINFIQVKFLPLFMLWSINVFSAMGSRDYRYGTLKVISAIPYGKLRVIICTWLSGLILALAMALPVILRMLLAGQIVNVFAVIAGIVFLPSLAVFLGEFTRTSRAFELLFVVVTYGALNNVGVFMYMGIHPDVFSLLRASSFLILSIFLVVTAVLKREIYV